MIPANLPFVHRFVPGTSDATLLALHGTGGDENDLLPLARQVAPAANILSLRGQVLEDGMPRFFRRLAMGVFDEADLVRRAAELAALVPAAASAYEFNPARVFALGYSNGANIAAALLLLHPGTLAGAALLRPVLPIEPPSPPSLAGVGVFVAAGTRDPYAPHERVEALAARLREAGAAVDVHWYDRGHELGRPELDDLRAWTAARL